ncbi:hypothetical protein [uncultured Ruminococcus sp.]|uniref:hypothetical protein n=1 Tax=uncultured Ruminococcus sp. TaxID=165186 RepID=UPI0025DA5FAB|nr:hypothetical protein [uncultured Ruminococcus sp.]
MISKKKTDNLKSLFLLNRLFDTNDNKNPYSYLEDGAHLRYVKYSSGAQVYKILSSDSLFAFNSELSNDWSENKILDFQDKNDIYITCFYCDYEKNKPGDIYSQWTSYCQGGGTAIEFYFGQNLVFKSLSTINPGEENDDVQKFAEGVSELVDGTNEDFQKIFDYSIMASNDIDSKYILYPQYPFPVSYYQNDVDGSCHLNDSNTYYKKLSSNISKTNLIYEDYGLEKINISHFAPYIKHKGFRQEQEARLAFINRGNMLSNCIRFIGDNKVPYICVRFGNQDSNLGPCDMLEKYEGKTLDEKAENFMKSLGLLDKNPSVPIIIPQGYNQEEIFNAVEKQVIQYNKGKNSKNRISIICQGHLPITKITLAPTNDRELQKKKLEIFCKSKYWLRNVEINTSDLPYNMININHT